MIKLKHIHIGFKKILIKDANIQIDNGKITAIQGKSGIGKTSLLYVIGLLEKLDQTTKYVFDGQLLNNQSPKKMAMIRRQYIGYVFQDSSILAHLSIKENFQYNFRLCQKRYSLKKVKALLEMVDLSYLKLNRMPTTLSGGERQRLAIALALCKNPRLLILDEPTSALDHQHTQQIMTILKKIAHEQNKMVLIASHDHTILPCCDTIYEINNQDIHLVKGQLTHSQPKRRLKEQKLSMTFYFDYVKRYFKHFQATYLLLILICGLGISLLSLASPIEDIMINFQNQSFNQNFNPEIFIGNYCEDTSVYYLDVLPPLAPETIKQIKQIEGITEMFPYREVNLTEVMIDQKTFNGSYLIQPYLATPDEGAKLSQYFTQYGKAQNIEMTIAEQTQELVISDYYDITEGNPYSLNAGWIIRIPYSLLNDDKTMSSCYVLHCPDYTQVETIAQQIKQIDQNIGICYNHRQVETYQKEIKQLKTTIRTIEFVLFSIVTLATIWIYSKHLKNRRLELCLLRANGLARSQLISLLLLEITMLALLMGLISIGIWAISSLIISLSK